MLEAQETFSYAVTHRHWLCVLLATRNRRCSATQSAPPQNLDGTRPLHLAGASQHTQKEEAEDTYNFYNIIALSIVDT